MKRSMPEAPPRLPPAHRLCATALFLCLMLGSAIAPAQQAPATPWYDVELIVFRNRSLQADGEQWSGPAPVAEPEFASEPARNTLQELPADQYALNNVAGALQRSGSYEVLLHKAWRQPGNDRTTAVAYILPRTKDGAGNELGGSIRLVRERFLHLDVDIVAGPGQPAYRPYGPGNEPVLSVPVYRLNESRRIRSGELHYFDHPYLGVIARVVPYTPPEPPVPAGTVTVEDSDPRVVTDEPLPGGGEQGQPAGVGQ